MFIITLRVATYNLCILKTTISTINCVKEISIELGINYKPI